MKVQLELSFAEAVSLVAAAGNTVEYDDALQAVLPHWASQEAARRAYKKLIDATVEADPLVTMKEN